MEEENKHSVHFSSKSQTWNTPLEIFNPLNDLWGFTLDVACLPDSALCSKYFTPEDDGLEQDWGNEICWMNPPYDDIRTWSKKAVSAYKNGATVVVLIPARTDTQALPSWTEDGTHVKNGAPFPSMLVVLDNNLTDEKIEHLKSLGITMVLA